MTVFADTSFYIALGFEKDAFHKDAVDFVRTYDGLYVTTEYVLFEFGNHLSASAKRPLFLNLYNHLSKHAQTTIVPALAELTRKEIDCFASRMDKNWSLTDCISFTLMEKMAIKQAASADHHFEQAGFEMLIKPIRK